MEIVASPSRTGSRLRLHPYLVIGVVWFGILVLASKFRTIEPVYLWVWSQAMLAERLLGVAGSLAYWVLLFSAYMIAGLVAWIVVERNRPADGHVWRRAIMSWVGVQAVYAIIAALLVQLGILYE